MITLKELLHSVERESKDGLINLDDWRWPDVDHLVSMGFEFGDDYHLNTSKSPKLSVYKKRQRDDVNEVVEEYFYVEEEQRDTKRFKNFREVMDYFDNYSQPELDKNL